MFSNTAVLGAALWAVTGSGPGFVSGNPTEQAVAEAATNHVAPEIIFAPADHHQVIPDSKESLSLMREDSFYWAHDGEELIANMTITTLPHVRLLNEHNFVDLVHSVDCSSAHQIKLVFKSTNTVVHARQAWSSWLTTSSSTTTTNTNTTNTLVFVTDSQGCGGQHGRQPYHVRDVTFDDAAGAAHLHAHAEARWTDFVEDATVTIGEPPIQSHPSPDQEDGDNSHEIEEHEIQRRHWSYSKKLNISLNHNFTRPIYHTAIGPAHLSLTCADCVLHGALATHISVSTTHGLSASALTANDLHLRLLLALSASAPVATSRLSRTSLNITRLALADFQIADIVHLTPLLDLVMAVQVGDIHTALDLAAGVELGFADGQSIDIGHHVGATRLDPVFRRIGPTISGEASATARFDPLLTLHLSGSILGKHVTGGVGLAAPSIALAVGADVGGPNPCAANATSTVHFSVNVGVEVDSFYGFGSSGDEPNKHSVFKKDHPLLNECIAISH